MEMDKEMCSPNGVLEDFMRAADSEASSHRETTSHDCESQSRSRSIFQWRNRFVHLLKAKSTLNWQSSSSAFSNSPNFKNFTFSQLQTATHNFINANLIGKGGYAEVYKGCLENGGLVAIKRITRGSPDEKVKSFLLEMGIMAHVSHPNIIRLIGYGVEGGFFLVLELSSHGSLASLLHGSKKKPTWAVRYKIAFGTAQGLLYLHEGCQRRIIHRDIKAANILLTENYNPKICDFGLAKWLPEQWTHLTVSKFEGTFGYLAPEYSMHGIVDDKTDVFAFGVLLLELISGRKALDFSQQSLVMWAKPLLKKRKFRELIDPSLGNDYNMNEISVLALAASSCLRHSSIRRPRMIQVVQVLEVDNRHLGGAEKDAKPGRLNPKRRLYSLPQIAL